MLKKYTDRDNQRRFNYPKYRFNVVNNSLIHKECLINLHGNIYQKYGNELNNEWIVTSNEIQERMVLNINCTDSEIKKRITTIWRIHEQESESYGLSEGGYGSNTLRANQNINFIINTIKDFNILVKTVQPSFINKIKSKYNNNYLTFNEFRELVIVQKKINYVSIIKNNLDSEQAYQLTDKDFKVFNNCTIVRPNRLDYSGNLTNNIIGLVDENNSLIKRLNERQLHAMNTKYKKTIVLFNR